MISRWVSSDDVDTDGDDVDSDPDPEVDTPVIDADVEATQKPDWTCATTALSLL
jgi:hypothetical protein